MTKPLTKDEENEIIKFYNEVKSVNKVKKKFHRAPKTIKEILKDKGIEVEENSGGRPKIELDYGLIRNLSMIMCTQEEIASVVGCSVDTLLRDDKFCEVYKKGLDVGKSSLRRFQWKQAEKNPTMAIWLGKQYLGQRDNVELENNDLSKLDEILEDIKNGTNK